MIPALPVSFDGKRAIPSQEVTRLMGDLLQLKPSDKLLEIGTGSGYQTSEWAKSGCEVHSIELEPWIDSTIPVGDCVFLHSGDGQNGLPAEAPFSAIVATCGLEAIPRAWIEQLGENGRLVAPIGDNRLQRLTLFCLENATLVPLQVAAYVRFQMLRNRPPVREVRPVYKEQHAG